ncbi:MAG: aspartate carbamoyltransferase regulatory subunit [Bacteroidaceae bacterium]|nr:aspartate carbamoyltransferase regulatory subunit [Bacteroidaceae bacterium]
MNKNERLVAAIKNGTVIDHIPADKTFQVVYLLGLDKTEKAEGTVTIGINFASNKVGLKGIIKVENRIFTDEEISRLSVVAPNVVLNIIKEYEVVEKKTVNMPEHLYGLVKCNNPKCITNNEPMKTVFHVIDADTVKCHYCEKEQKTNKVQLC